MLRDRGSRWRMALACTGLCCGMATAFAQSASPRAPGTATEHSQSPSPRWAGLAAAQRQALKPLRPTWNTLSEAQRRKWIALALNFDKLPVSEQQKLHQRMGDWAKLSPNERNQARLNFAEAERLVIDDKQAKWDAYQALSEEERRKLAEQAPRRPAAGAAVAVRPIPRQRLATMPVPPENVSTMPRISTAPHLIHPQTLLPQVDIHATDLEMAPAR